MNLDVAKLKKKEKSEAVPLRMVYTFLLLIEEAA